MKVVLINSFYGIGSTGTIVKDLEDLCLKNGIECFVASPDLNVRKAKRGIKIGNFFDHKIHAILCRLLGKQAYFSKRATRSFLKTLNSIKPDVVHLHNIHSNFINQALLLNYLAENTIATMLTLHDCWFYTGGCFHYTSTNCSNWQHECGNCPKRFSSIPSLRYIDCTRFVLKDRNRLFSKIPRLVVVGVSHWISGEAEKSILKNSRITTIHNGIDANIFKPRESEVLKNLGIDNKFVILGPANKWLLPENRGVLNYFCDHMKEDEVLLLYGSQNKSHVESLNIIYIDFITSKEKLSEIYSAANVFVNCSREDSLSLINLEAQACGTPVVTFGVTGLSDTVDNINSFSVPVGDAKLLYNKVTQIRRSNIKQNNACRNFILDNYQIDKNYQKYIELYRQLANHSCNISLS